MKKINEKFTIALNKLLNSLMHSKFNALQLLKEKQKSMLAEKARDHFFANLDNESHFFIWKRNNKNVGYAVKNTVVSKDNLNHFMIILDSKKNVLDVLVLETHKRYKNKGSQLLSKQRFLSQIDKSNLDLFLFNENIKQIKQILTLSYGTTDKIINTNEKLNS